MILMAGPAHSSTQLRPNIEGRGPEGEGPSKNVKRGDHSNADGEAARARLDRD
jgi:hypothetical protein